MTSLTTLAFLGHGETLDSPEFGLTVNKAFQFLLGKGPQKMMYEHAMMTYALAEGYGITRFPGLKPPLQEAVDVLIKAQKVNKSTKHVGGWRYSSSSIDSDTSVTGWCVQALKAAKAAGADVPDETLDLASQYLWKMYANGTFGYESPDGSFRPSVTAIGVFSQSLLNQVNDPRIRPSLDRLKTVKPDWDKDTMWPLYAWYYMTHAQFQGGGQYWEHWDNSFRETLLRHQSADGHWDSPTASKENYGPTYSTAFCTLMLEVYYRYPATPTKASPLPPMSTLPPLPRKTR
jgi:hypothetical protein